MLISIKILKKKLRQIFFTFKHRRPIQAMQKELSLHDLKTFRHDTWHHGYAYFTAYMNDRPVFIKVDTQFHFLSNEVLANQLIKDKLKIPDLYAHFISGEFEAVVFEFLPAQLLNARDIFNNPELLEKIFFIIQTMNAQGIIHRDIKLNNFMLANQEVFIIDFTFATSKHSHLRFKELDARVKSQRKILNSLGDGHNPSHWVWNDFLSMNHILEEMIQITPINDEPLRSQLLSYQSRFKAAHEGHSYCLN
jgi:serine/threonine protein kinase